MKNKITSPFVGPLITLGLAVAAAVTIATFAPVEKAQAASTFRSDGNPLYSVTYHSPGGATNITTGFTNALVYRPVTGSLLTLDFEAGGTTVNVSNNVTIVVFPSWDGTTNDTTAAARIQLLPTTTFKRWTTNVSTIWGAPYAAIQLENPSSNVGCLTNVVLRYNSKLP